MYIAISQSTCHYVSEGRQSASLLDERIATIGWQYQDTLTDKSEEVKTQASTRTLNLGLLLARRFSA